MFPRASFFFSPRKTQYYFERLKMSNYHKIIVDKNVKRKSENFGCGTTNKQVTVRNVKSNGLHGKCNILLRLEEYTITRRRNNRGNFRIL